jgi:hypothetical protein
MEHVMGQQFEPIAVVDGVEVQAPSSRRVFVADDKGHVAIAGGKAKRRPVVITTTCEVVS